GELETCSADRYCHPFQGCQNRPVFMRDAGPEDAGPEDAGGPCGQDCEALATACMRSTCNPDAGTCEMSPRLDGTGCDDDNPCSVDDTCQAGECRGVPEADHAPCDDGNSCTLADRCLSGRCRSDTQRDCSALTDMCNAGTCDAETGECRAAPVTDGTLCDDGDPETTSNAC